MAALWELQSHHRAVAGPLCPSKGLPVVCLGRSRLVQALAPQGEQTDKSMGLVTCPTANSPHSPGRGTSRRSVGREICLELEGTWRGGSLYRTCVKHQRVGESDTRHPRHQIHAAGCLPRATLAPWQTRMHGHSWASLVPPSPQDDAVILLSPLPAGFIIPAPGRLVAASAAVPGPEQSPGAVNQGTAPQLPLPSGPASAAGSRASRSGTHRRALGGAKVGPCKAPGWGFAESSGGFTAAPCMALIASNEHPH